MPVVVWCRWGKGPRHAHPGRGVGTDVWRRNCDPLVRVVGCVDATSFSRSGRR